MKKTLLFFLLLAGTGDTLHAQFNLPNTYDVTFNNPEPGKSNAIFTFYLADRKRIVLEFQYASQVEYLPNLDSVLRLAVAMLDPLKDSLKSDGVVRRTDIVVTRGAPKIRILSHPQYTNTYTIHDKELMQLKMNQDTVRIISFAQSRAFTTINRNGVKSREQLSAPFVITILVNNTGDISGLPEGIMQQCIDLLKPHIERYYPSDTKRLPLDNLRGQFNMVTKQYTLPIHPRFYRPEPNVSLIFGFGLTSVRGSITPSFQTGLSLTTGNASFYNKWRLFIEFQAFFSRDAANKLITDYNQFLTFQLLQGSAQSRNNTLSLEGNLTLGYLINRQGEWYEKNTFKLGLPVLASRFILIEPQIVFNDFFRNVSPSVKFSFNF